MGGRVKKKGGRERGKERVRKEEEDEEKGERREKTLKRRKEGEEKVEEEGNRNILDAKRVDCLSFNLKWSWAEKEPSAICSSLHN